MRRKLKEVKQARQVKQASLRTSTGELIGSLDDTDLNCLESRTVTPAAVNRVALRGHVIVDCTLVARLIEFEMRGCMFALAENGLFRMAPMDRLTPADVTFLRVHRDEVHRVLEYQADAPPVPSL